MQRPGVGKNRGLSAGSYVYTWMLTKPLSGLLLCWAKFRIADVLYHDVSSAPLTVLLLVYIRSAFKYADQIHDDPDTIIATHFVMLIPGDDNSQQGELACDVGTAVSEHSDGKGTN